MLGSPPLSAADAAERYGGDASHLRGRPSGAVRPADRDELVAVVQWARRHRVALVARGAGTSLDGESVPADGAVVVDLTGWDQVVELAVEDRLVRVGPGLINRALDRRLAEVGLFFPPNPGSWTTSTLGGNVATNAAGPRSFKYGSTRRWVLGAEVVLGTGEAIAVGGRVGKRSTGPDLLALLVGSEGTLGIFTELTLALAPRPARRTALVVPVPPGAPLGRVARAIARWPTSALSAVEYLDRSCAEALTDESRGRLPSNAALLLLELESADEAAETVELAHAMERLERIGLTEPAVVAPDADELWTLRGRSGLALEQRWGTRLREDVAVPLSRIDELLASIAAIGASLGIAVPVFGHIGDGNLHPNFVVDPASPTGLVARTRLLRAARDLGGTISAEHGIGSAKAEFLPWEVPAAGLAVLRAVKSACDPDGILNPGKIVLASPGEQPKGPDRRPGPG